MHAAVADAAVHLRLSQQPACACPFALRQTLVVIVLACLLALLARRCQTDSLPDQLTRPACLVPTPTVRPVRHTDPCPFPCRLPGRARPCPVDQPDRQLFVLGLSDLVKSLSCQACPSDVVRPLTGHRNQTALTKPTLYPTPLPIEPNNVRLASASCICCAACMRAPLLAVTRSLLHIVAVAAVADMLFCGQLLLHKRHICYGRLPSQPCQPLQQPSSQLAALLVINSFQASQ